MLPKIPKDDALKKLILEAIKDNLLFRVRIESLPPYLLYRGE